MRFSKEYSKEKHYVGNLIPMTGVSKLSHITIRIQEEPFLFPNFLVVLNPFFLFFVERLEAPAYLCAENSLLFVPLFVGNVPVWQLQHLSAPSSLAPPGDQSQRWNDWGGKWWHQVAARWTHFQSPSQLSFHDIVLGFWLLPHFLPPSLAASLPLPLQNKAVDKQKKRPPRCLSNLDKFTAVSRTPACLAFFCRKVAWICVAAFSSSSLRVCKPRKPLTTT